MYEGKGKIEEFSGVKLDYSSFVSNFEKWSENIKTLVHWFISFKLMYMYSTSSRYIKVHFYL